MTLDQAAKELQRMAAALPGAMQGVVRSSTLELRDIARDPFSSGTLSEAEVNKRHPYSRRRGAQLAPYIVNSWTGAFRDAWEYEASGDRGEIWNSDPKAANLEAGLVKGRPLMAPRKPHEAAADVEEPLFAARVERELGRVLGV